MKVRDAPAAEPVELLGAAAAKVMPKKRGAVLVEYLTADAARVPSPRMCSFTFRHPGALGFGVSWVMPVHCSPLHKLRSLFQASESRSAMWKSCGTQGRLRWCAASCPVVAGCGTLFSEDVAVGDLAVRRVTCRPVVLRRMAFCRVASRAGVVALCCGVLWRVLCCVVWRWVVSCSARHWFCHVALCVVWWRLVLWCSIVLCCVMWCSFSLACGVSCFVMLSCIAGCCRVPPCGVLCSCCVVWCVVACCVVLGCVVVVVCGCVGCRAWVCGGVYVVWRGVASQCVVVCRVSCWYLVGSTGYVNCCVAVLRGFSLCASVVSRVLWCCFARGVCYCVLFCGRVGVGLRLVVLRGAVSCGVVACFVAVRCGVLPCGLLCCVV